MQRAQKRGAIMNQKFYFRKRIFPLDTPPLSHTTSAKSVSGSPDSTPSLAENANIHHERARNNGQSNGAHKAWMIGNDGIKNRDRRGSNCPSEESTTSSFDRTRSAPFSAAQSRCPSPHAPEFGPIEDEYEELTIAEIINGKVREEFPPPWR